MNTSLLKFAKACLSKPSLDLYERPLAYAILDKVFTQLASVSTFAKREALWQKCVCDQTESQQIVYIEFGVHQGYSLKYFAEHNSHRESSFIGLDSFEGLPENWGHAPKGTFDVGGSFPKTDDPRISFIKGWFQDTWDDLNVRLARSSGQLIVHYDADLYSSTLFALSKIDSIKKEYTAIFDEFTGHETRALHNYVQAYGATVSFLGKTELQGYPNQIVARISPRGAAANHTLSASA